jgi:tripartite-type tricarboxylate transporter receptor subunit TctC
MSATKLIGALALAWVMQPSVTVAGETWPDRTVKFIVPFGAGAGADIGGLADGQ